MTLDELIAAATELRSQVGGDAPVLMLTLRGYASVLLTDSFGFADATCSDPAPIVLVTPGAVLAASNDAGRSRCHTDKQRRRDPARSTHMASPKGHGEPVLYMDFDGVAHHENCVWHPSRGAYLHAPERYRLFQHAPLLETLLQPYPDIKVVLSTSWVRRYGCAGAAKRLPVGLRMRVIGATYHSRMPSAGFALLTRGEQVTEDVLRRRPGSWLALDDDPIGWPQWAAQHLLLTDPYEGISPSHIQDDLRRRLALLANLQPRPVYPGM